MKLSNDFVAAALCGDLCRLLRIRCQVNIDCINRKWGFTALMAAAGNGHLDTVRYLVTCGANINQQDNVIE
jgi:ankyrin repeat protein